MGVGARRLAVTMVGERDLGGCMQGHLGAERGQVVRLRDRAGQG